MQHLPEILHCQSPYRNHVKRYRRLCQYRCFRPCPLHLHSKCRWTSRCLLLQPLMSRADRNVYHPQPLLGRDSRSSFPLLTHIHVLNDHLLGEGRYLLILRYQNDCRHLLLLGCTQSHGCYCYFLNGYQSCRCPDGNGMHHSQKILVALRNANWASRPH